MCYPGLAALVPRQLDVWLRRNLAPTSSNGRPRASPTLAWTSVKPTLALSRVIINERAGRKPPVIAAHAQTLVPDGQLAQAVLSSDTAMGNRTPLASAPFTRAGRNNRSPSPQQPSARLWVLPLALILPLACTGKSNAVDHTTVAPDAGLSFDSVTVRVTDITPNRATLVVNGVDPSEVSFELRSAGSETRQTSSGLTELAPATRYNVRVLKGRDSSSKSDGEAVAEVSFVTTPFNGFRAERLNLIEGSRPRFVPSLERTDQELYAGPATARLIDPNGDFADLELTDVEFEGRSLRFRVPRGVFEPAEEAYEYHRDYQLWIEAGDFAGVAGYGPFDSAFEFPHLVRIDNTAPWFESVNHIEQITCRPADEGKARVVTRLTFSGVFLNGATTPTCTTTVRETGTDGRELELLGYPDAEDNCSTAAPSYAEQRINDGAGFDSVRYTDRFFLRYLPQQLPSHGTFEIQTKCDWPVNAEDDWPRQASNIFRYTIPEEGPHRVEPSPAEPVGDAGVAAGAAVDGGMPDAAADGDLNTSHQDATSLSDDTAALDAATTGDALLDAATTPEAPLDSGIPPALLRDTGLPTPFADAAEANSQ